MPNYAVLPAHWKPVPVALVRLGSKQDGGYVVSKDAVDASAGLISFGIARDWSFELDLASLKPADFTIDCFDPTTDLPRAAGISRSRRIRQVLSGKRHWRHVHIGGRSGFNSFFNGSARTLHRNWICRPGQSGVASLTFDEVMEKLSPRKPVFLKVDIEGSEWSVLDGIVRHSNMIAGMAIEFHNLQSKFSELGPDHRLFQAFSVCNVHANNCVPEFTSLPEVIEFSFFNKKLQLADGSDAVDRANLNAPNTRANREITLGYAGTK
ncbi:MAG: FkbM family methyltransferase [Rhizobiaceae bacterium]